MIKPSEISDILKKQLDEVDSKINFEEVGTVLEVGDGVAHVYGLENVRSSELIEFENGVHGVAMNLEESNVGVILLDNVDKVTENMTARRTGEIASLPVGEGLLGRVINTLGEPIDGAGPIQGDLIRLPLERKAPGVIFRQPVNEPLQTGIKAIDSMVPIGRGQRELIIGDRQIGKTAIAIDTIINQRDNYKNGNPLYCIYVAIGQKASSVAALVNTLKEHGALDYTVVLAANASDSAAMRYYAPFAGAAIGEYFRPDSWWFRGYWCGWPHAADGSGTGSRAALPDRKCPSSPARYRKRQWCQGPPAAGCSWTTSAAWSAATASSTAASMVKK